MKIPVCMSKIRSLALVCFMVITVIGCSEDIPVTENTVKYTVTGTASQVDITLSNKQEGTEQYSNEDVPWEYSFSTTLSDRFVYISAQNQGSSGTVTVSIYTNGKLYRSSTSSGAYVIATAYGSVF